MPQLNMNRRVIIGALLAVIGLIPAFFLVFATIFSDAAGAADYIVPFLLIILVYGLLGLVAGYALRGWTAGLWPSAGAVAIVALYSQKERAHLGLHLLVLLITLAAAVAGAYAGVLLRARGARR